LGRNYPGTIGLVGDAKVAVRKLISALDSRTRRQQWVERAQGWVEEWETEFEPLLNSDAVPIRPERLCQELSDLLPENAVLVSDTGYSAIWTGTMVQLTHPEQSYIRAAGSLGWAFPAALGENAPRRKGRWSVLPATAGSCTI